jgi:glycosyltransferase involved in cell wall biosynthesis
MSIPGNRVDEVQLADVGENSRFSSYPIDMSSFLTLPHCKFDAQGIPYRLDLEVYDPTIIAQHALANWNQYLATNDEVHQRAFLAQAYWLVTHERRIGADAGGWPISFAHPDIFTEGPWLSALTQGTGISVLTRANQLTREEVFLEVARRAVRTFERDILDGGVSAPIGADGVFFEEVAVYPAAHMLSGFIFGLFGLYDYVALTDDPQIEKLIARSLATMHNLLDEFDIDFWTRSGLLYRRLASPSDLALQVALLEALARYSGCDHCSTLTLRWKKYQRGFGTRLRYLIAHHRTSYSHAFWDHMRRILFPKGRVSDVLRVCVPITGFPVAGGTRAVLAGVAQVTRDIWQLEYLTRHVEPHPEEFVIHRFGSVKMHPWQFPNLWLYFLVGCRKLISLMRHGADYHVILPQDGVFTAAFAALAAKLAGVRVVCMDHGNLTLLKSRTYRAERIQALAISDWSWLHRLFSRLRYMCYWPSLYLLACISTRFVDHFLIPGVEGDGVEEACKQLGVHSSRITRFASMIDIHRYPILDTTSKANAREEHGIEADAVVIAMVCRLAPEKGVDIALEGIDQALTSLSPELRAHVRVIIAGDGSLRKHIEEGIHRRGLSQTFLLWGETSAEDVISLLSLSDIFLYTSTRGACLSMAILEAMASGCAVIASPLPLANVHMLAEGRGIIVSAGDAGQTGRALAKLLNDPELCRKMGSLARDYVAVQHNATMLKRALMRVTNWSALDTLLQVEMESEA